MEGDSLYGERSSIRDQARSLKKYGSTCNHVRNSTNFTLIRHDVTTSDTLQGIALKYGCTTEQIRRANRLYASDSLFSRPHLMIPVTKGSPYYPTAEDTQNHNSSSISNTSTSSSHNNSLPDNHWPHSALFPEDSLRHSDTSTVSSPGPWDPLQSPPGPSSSSSISSGGGGDLAEKRKPRPAPPPVVEECLSPEEEHKKDLDALLGKIDSTIANSRKFVVNKSQDSSEFASVEEEEDGEDFVDYYDGAYQNASTTHDTSHLITNSRQVKSSLRRLEQTQDELFEL